MGSLSLNSALYYFTLFRIWAILLSAIAVIMTYKISKKKSALVAIMSALTLFLAYAFASGQLL